MCAAGSRRAVLLGPLPDPPCVDSARRENTHQVHSHYLILPAMSKDRRGAKDNTEGMVVSDEDQGDAPSPKKPRASGTLGLDDIRALLDLQTRELREAQKLEMNRALSQLKHENQTMFNAVDASLKAQSSDIAQVKTAQADMEKRIARLELTGASSAAGSTAGLSDDRPPAVIFGGWGPEVKKGQLLDELDAVLKEAQLAGKLDSKPYAPGVRKGIAVSTFQLRDAESPQDLRSRMLDVVRGVNDEDAHTPTMGPSRKMWAALSKPKPERERASHASKIRRVLHQLAGGLVNMSEAEYATGTVYLGDQVAGSAVKPRPKGHFNIADGKLATSWINISHIAKVAKVTEAHVHSIWQDAIGDC